MVEFDSKMKRALIRIGFAEGDGGEMFKEMNIKWTVERDKKDVRYCMLKLTAIYDGTKYAVQVPVTVDALDLLLRKDESVDKMLFDWFKKLFDKIYGKGI